MEQSGNLLLSIINNVLDMAKIESGKMELDENYVKIRDVYQGVYKIFQAEAEKKGIHLEMEYEVQHEHVICDETKNREIFLNLISNAVKYTASGGAVTIRITELDCDRKDYVRIQTQVIDTGIGMSEEFLPSLFEAFARERNTTAAKVAGTGLGMPIIKKYVDMMAEPLKQKVSWEKEANLQLSWNTGLLIRVTTSRLRIRPRIQRKQTGSAENMFCWLRIMT